MSTKEQDVNDLPEWREKDFDSFESDGIIPLGELDEGESIDVFFHSSGKLTQTEFDRDGENTVMFNVSIGGTNIDGEIELNGDESDGIVEQGKKARIITSSSRFLGALHELLKDLGIPSPRDEEIRITAHGEGMNRGYEVESL